MYIQQDPARRSTSVVLLSYKLSQALNHKTATAQMKACDCIDGNALVQEPTIQPECLVFWEKFVKTVCQSFNVTEGPKWKCQQITWREDKRRSMREVCHSPDSSCGRQRRQDEGGSSTLSETLPLRQECLLAKMQQQQRPSCFHFVTVFQEEMRESWGPS